MYKRIAAIKNEADAQDVYDELTDRFGAPPSSVWGLIEIALLRNSAKALGINILSVSLIFNCGENLLNNSGEIITDGTKINI